MSDLKANGPLEEEFSEPDAKGDAESNLSTEEHTTNYPSVSTIEKAIWLRSDLSGFYFDRCTANLGDGPAYFESFERLQLVLTCIDSLLKRLNQLLWGVSDAH